MIAIVLIGHFRYPTLDLHIDENEWRFIFILLMVGPRSTALEQGQT